jgi:hypothetical protein
MSMSTRARGKCNGAAAGAAAGADAGAAAGAIGKDAGAAEQADVTFERDFLKVQMVLKRMHDDLSEHGLDVAEMHKRLEELTTHLASLRDAHVHGEAWFLALAGKDEEPKDKCAALRELKQNWQLLVRLQNTEARRTLALEEELKNTLEQLNNQGKELRLQENISNGRLVRMRRLEGIGIANFEMERLVELLDRQTQAMKRVKYMVLRRKAEELVADAVDSVLCPIGRLLMRDPVQAADGHTYERSEIEKWLRSSDKSPKTNVPMCSKELTHNFAMRSCIDELVEAKLKELMAHMDKEVASACLAVQQAMGGQFGAEAASSGGPDAKRPRR